MKYKPDIIKKVERYRRFWAGEALDPPLIMVNMPESAITTGGHDCAFWRDPDGFVRHFLDALALHRRIPDDTIPMLRPPFSHAALPAILGCPPELHEGKLWVRPILKNLGDFKHIVWDNESYWLEQFHGYYRRLLDLSENRFAVALFEIPGPADLMGALRGYENILTDLYDDPETVQAFALQAADWAVTFHQKVTDWLAGQESFGGYWAANSWITKDTIYFCEHSCVNYSPAHYERFLKPANDRLLTNFGHALTFVYLKAGAHLVPYYTNRGRPVWIRGCDVDPTAEQVNRYRKQVVFSVRTTVDQYNQTVARYGPQGVCYQVDCASLDQAIYFCKAVGL